MAGPTSPNFSLPDEPDWPVGDARPIVFLLDAATPLEQRVLEGWVTRHRPADFPTTDLDRVQIPPSRGRRRKLDQRLEPILATDEDPLMAPLRVAWLRKGEFEGVHGLGLFDVLTLSDPRDPDRLRQAWTLRTDPGRCRVVAGEPARLSELRERWRMAGGASSGETTGLADFVARQAALALERAERRLRGARYKVPRLVKEDIVSRPAFRGGVARLARSLSKPLDKVAAEAEGCLKEIAATHSPFVIDLVAQGIHLLYTRGYGENLHYDRARLNEIYSLAQRHPVIFLPSHKSNLDHLVLQYALHEQGLPPNHTAGGINMNFMPVGPLVRRSGVFFIRRSFKDNEVYKFVLRHYIDYLIEKRFSLEWYVEGGRSRSGKLLPPRFGLLAYVVDAYLRGRSDDVVLLPVSIAYDQIQDVGDYAAEQRGAAKATESFGWFVGLVRKLGRRYGDIHLRFGEPVSLRETLGPPDESATPDPDAHSLRLQKVAFQVCDRINRVTPVTPTSLVTLALLGVGDKALTIEETMGVLGNLLNYVEVRGLPVTEDLDLRSSEEVLRVLDHLVENGVVSCFDEGPEAVYAIRPDQHLAAAYYRNTIIHFFVAGAIAELALLAAAADEVSDAVTAFWDEATRLRDLLKFEFFFAEKAEFLEETRAELASHDADWERRLATGGTEVRTLLHNVRPYNAHRILRPFLEAYQVVGDTLAGLNTAEPFEEDKFLARCLALGKQYQLQRRITRAESLSKVLFGTALRLARNRGLIDGDGGDLDERRKEFAGEIRAAVRRVDAIDTLAASRRAGLLD